jgi:hypothetical protein
LSLLRLCASRGQNSGIATKLIFNLYRFRSTALSRRRYYKVTPMFACDSAASSQFHKAQNE